MAKLCLTVHPGETGHRHRAFALATFLEEAGHEVVFAGRRAEASAYARRPFRHLTLESARDDERRLSGGVSAPLQEVARYQIAVARSAALFERERFDLLVADSSLRALPQLAWAQGVPVVWLHTHFPDRQVPWWRQVREDWRLAVHRASRSLDFRRVGRLIQARGAGWHRDTVWRQLGMSARARRLGHAGLGAAPRLVASIPELDLTGSRPRQRSYAGPLIDLLRPAQGEGLRHLSGARLPVYAYLGRQIWRRPAGRRFLQALVEAVETLTPAHMVLSTGGPDPGGIRGGDRVRIVRRAPQLDLLRHSRLVVSHAGLGTLHEALFHDVPVLVFPVGRDQPSNALRLERTGAGRVGSVVGPEPRRIAEAILAGAEDRRLRERARALGERLRHYQEARPAVRILEERLTARPR